MHLDQVPKMSIPGAGRLLRVDGMRGSQRSGCRCFARYQDTDYRAIRPSNFRGRGRSRHPSPSTSSNLLVFRLILQGPPPPSDGFDLYFAQPHAGQTGFQLCDPQKGPACIGGQTYERNFLMSRARLMR